MFMDKEDKLRHKDRVDETFKDAQKIDLRNEIQEQYGEQPKSWFAWIFDIIDVPPNSNVLELGCGTGALWEENRFRTPRSWEVLLTDRAFPMLRSARESTLKMRRKMHILGSDSQQLPFPSQSFDAVIAVGLLDLLPDLPVALKEIWRVLRPCGKFIATAGGKGHLKELESLVRPFLQNEEVEHIGGNEDRFGLENGEGWLADFFEDVSRYDFRDKMVFTEQQPVLEYVLSEQIIADSMTLEQLGRFVQRVKNQLAKNGSFNVTVRKGAFVARKAALPSKGCD